MESRHSRENRTLLQQERCLYEELLTCLEGESQALVNACAEAILAAVSWKEILLDRLLQLKRTQGGGPENPASAEDLADLAALQRQVAAANARNREIAAASLEVIQGFLAQFQPPDPGLYQPAGQAKAIPDGALFQRQA
jgi:flagellar biosynthesis/type III secretory pathway chaperone